MKLNLDGNASGIIEIPSVLRKKECESITKEYLENEYIILKKTLNEIAIENKTHSQKISKLLHKFGMKIRSKSEIADLKLSDFVGRRFDKLIVIRRKENSSRGSRWECKCDCGNVVIYTAHHLLQKDCKSCGCKRRTKYEEIPGSYFRNLRFGAKSRNLEYNLTPEFLWNLYLKQNRKCALSGVDITFDKNLNPKIHTASLDRINSSLGYVEENVQWVHKIVNQIKWDLSEDEFIKWISLIYHNKHILFPTLPLQTNMNCNGVCVPQYPPDNKNTPYC